MGDRTLSFRLSSTLVAAFLILGLASLAMAQENPDVARGFSAEKLYQFGELDVVNLFNGNLTLALPVGPSYSANGGLTYSLTLTYNSNVWRFEQRTWKKYDQSGNYQLITSQVAEMDRTYNASPGWKLSLGELLDPVDPDNPGTRFSYIGEDGSQHTFFDTLHNYETNVSTTWFTRDGSYLKLRKIGSGYEYQVDFPDGSVRSFYRDTPNWTSKFRPQWIRDAWGNQLTITQVSNLHWTFSDAYRSHDLYFTSRTIDGMTWKVVDRVELSKFGGGQATYQFHYAAKTIDESCYDDDDFDTLNDADGVMTPAQRAIYVLNDVTLPDGSKWSMPSYFGTCSEGSGSTLSDAENQPGVLKKLVLPTLGAYEWTYQDYRFPNRVVGGPQGAGTFSLAKSTGVRRKRMLNASGACYSVGEVGCEWTYEPTRNWGSFEQSTLVTYPTGDQSRFYFDVHWRSNPSTWDGWQYGLPFTTAQTDGSGRFLSQEIYSGTEATGSLQRKVYLRYERDRIDQFDLEPAQWEQLNQRVASRKTVFADDSNAWRTQDSWNFDGVGHYRYTSTTASWAGGGAREDFTNFNAGRGAYNVDAVNNTVNGGYLGAPPYWVLGTYTEKRQTESSDVARQDFCFDAQTGVVKRQRIRAGSGRGTHDLVRLYDRDGSGNVTLERHYGSDTGNVSTSSDLCNLGLSNDVYRRSFGYQYGTLQESRWLTGSGAHELWTYRSTVDQSTGLPASVTGADDITVTLSYDSSGRRTLESPQTGQGARTTFTYTRALSASSPAEVLIQEKTNAGYVVLTEAKAVFDPFGRFWRDQRLEPSGSWSAVDTVYNAMGWKHSVSERQLGYPNRQTVYKQFDPFGRPGRVEPPDDANHRILLWYAGERSRTRAYDVCSSSSGCASSSDETGYQVVELRDKQGRLYKVTEPSGSGGADVTTTYSYDVGNRLRLATTSGSGTTQTRVFNYDKRGFLTSEQHPEKGTYGNGSVSYSLYDALGNAGRKVDGPFDVRYGYDRAGRLVAVNEWTGFTTRPIKVFDYAPSSSGSDKRGGKLWTADRYNYVTLGGNAFTVRVRETYAYAGKGGAVSQRDTQMWVNGGASESFTQRFSWRDLGNLNYIDYPECTHSGCSTPSPRRVQFNFNTNHRGYLKSIQDLTTGSWLATAFSYHPNGLYSTITHGNSVVDHQSLETSAMARPAQIWTTGANSNWSSGAYRYDASGNVVAIGGSSYSYDGVSRLTRAVTDVGQYNGGGTDYTRTYTYDPFANLTYITGDVNKPGRSIPVSSSTNRLSGATYDAAGNVTSWNSTSFDYDAVGMLNKRIDSGGGERLFFYTADDERFWSYHWTGSRWTIRDLDGKVLRDYRSGTGGWSVERDYVYADGKLLAALKPNGPTYHYHLDHLGTPRLITNQNGAKLAFHTYFPYGEEVSNWNQDVETMKFTGHERDFYDSGPGDDLDYMHARYYGPLQGRFLTPDPKDRREATQQLQDLNRYAYVSCNPIKSVDPNGKETMVFIAAPSDVGDPKGLAGHAGIFVRVDGEGAGVSQYGEFNFDDGPSGFIRGYNGEERDVTMYVLKTTKDQDRRMLSFIKKNSDGGIDPEGSMMSQNCTTACVNVLRAGSMVSSEENPGATMQSFWITSPKGLQDSLENGDLSQLVTAVIELPAKPDVEEDENAGN